MMEFEDKIKIFASKINNKLEHVETEETTKTALILPFLSEVMGYDTSNPAEVKAEYTADVGSKKGEKIDLAIFFESQETILIECKASNVTSTKEQVSQLYRYFNITDAEIGILTNGVVYQFFTDSIKAGKMDQSPFMEINLLNLSERDIHELQKFTKEKYDITNIRSRVDNLKYAHDIRKILEAEIDSPSDDFVKVLTKQVYDGTFTANVKTKFYNIVKNEFAKAIDEKVEDRLNEALERTNAGVPAEFLDENDDVVTTKEEFEGYYIVKSIVAQIVDPDRVFIKDYKSYCNILLDDNSHFPIARMYFNDLNDLKIGLFDSFDKYESGGRKADVRRIKSLKELYDFKDRLVKTVEVYLKEVKQKQRKSNRKKANKK